MSSRNRSVIRVESLYRLFLLKFAKNKLPILLITEYPKSGASWLAQLISESAGLDFPRQRFPSLVPSIFHGHYRFKKSNADGKTVVFWRDPRDIMVSWYYHCLFKSDKNNHALVESIRGRLGFSDFNDIKSNLPKFIEYSFEESISPRFSFNDFYNTWYGRDDVVYSSYENLKVDPMLELLRVLAELGYDQPSHERLEEIIEKFSFKSQSSRSPGAENKSHYLRKGIVGDWKNNFSKESALVMQKYVGDKLIALTYETDDEWVKELS